MIQFKLNVNGVDRTFGFDAMRGRDGMEFLDVAKRAQDIQPALPAVHRILLDAEDEIFATEGASIGGRWVPYNNNERHYKKFKAAVLGVDAERIMRWSAGHEMLMPSLTSATDPNHSWVTSKTGFRFGTKLPYAKGHHEGTGVGWIPKRAKNKAKYFYIVPKRLLIGVNTMALGGIIRELQGYIFGRHGGNRGRGGIFA